MKKTISLILCFLMLISIVPVSASATDEKVGGVKAVANEIHNVSGNYMPEFTTLKVLDPSGADTGYMPVASCLYTQKSASSYNVAYQLKTAPEEGVTYYAYIQIPTSTGGNDVNASLVKIEITGYDIKYTGMNFSGSNLYINYTIRKTARVCGVEAEASGVKYDSTLDGYAPEFTKLESVTANGSATGYDASIGALYESYNAGTLGNKLTTAPVEGATYYSYINLENPLGVHYVEDSLVDIEISGYDVEFIGAYERDMGFRIQVVYKLTKISRVCGVNAEASGVALNYSYGAYSPMFIRINSLDSNGGVTGYNGTSGVLYESYNAGTWGNKLTTAPVEGATYYSYIDLDNPLGVHYVEDSLVDIEIPGYDVEFIGAYERDMGFRIQVVYSVRKTARVCGVEAEASGVEYNSTLGGYAPKFTKLESVMENGSATGYDANTGALYESYNAGTWGNKLTSAPVEGATYYSYLTLKNPEGNHHIVDSLVDIEIPGYDVEFIGAYERDMGFNIQVVYKLTKIALVRGVKAEEGAVWYRTSENAYVVEFDKLTSIGTNGSATGYDVEAAALYKSYTAGILGDKLTTTPVDGATYYSYIDLENPLGIYYIEDSLVDIEISGYDVEFVAAYERDMGFRIQVVYKLTKQYTRVTGLKAVASGVQFNNTAGAYAPVFTTLNAIAANGTVQAYDIEGAVLYKSCSGTSFDDKLTTVPVVGEKYYSYIRFENPEGNLDIENALVNISVAGYEVEYIASYEGDMGFSVMVVYSLVHKTHTGGTATCTEQAVCAECGVKYGELAAHKISEIKGKAATCTANGIIDHYKCSKCSMLFSDAEGKKVVSDVSVKAKGHDYAAATCTEAKTCKVCGATSGSKLGHTYDNACDTTCNRCSATRTITHDYNAATCTAAKNCKVCGATSGKALGHTYDNACDTTCNRCSATRTITHDYIAATCTKAKTCSVCKATSGSALGHKWTAATCTKAKTCSVCKATSGSALGHKWTAATCTKAKTCSVCKATSGSALGHKWTAATCTKAKTCSVCKATSGSALGHKWTAATCTKAKTCSVCKATSGKALGHKYSNACDTSCNTCKATRKITHSYKSTTTKATLTKNGKVVNKCTVCGNVKSTTTVYYPKTIKLSKTAYTYNGKEQKPSVTVKDSKGNALKKDTDYTVKYEGGRKNTGTYTVTITFKGKYSGTKTLKYTIAPKATSKITVAQSTKAIKLTWSKVTGATGYRVYQYNTKTKKWDNIKTLTGTSFKVEKLKAGTSYKFRVKAYKKDDGTIWSAAKDITTATKPATSKITKLTTAKAKATLVWSDVAGENGFEVYASTKKDSGFKKVATTKANTVKVTVSKLTSGKTYYFKVRSYKTVGDAKVYSAWSAVKSIKIK